MGNRPWNFHKKLRAHSNIRKLWAGAGDLHHQKHLGCINNAYRPLHLVFKTIQSYIYYKNFQSFTTFLNR